MRTLFLLAAATFTVATATAQQVNRNIDPCGMRAIYDPIPLTTQPVLNRINGPSNSTARTTTTHSRWYNYGDYLADAYPTAFAAVYLWNDSTSVCAYSDGHGSIFKHNDMASVGYVCDPTFPLWNDVAAYPGVMAISPTDAYVIDSVFISGVYMRNNNKTTPVDTLTVAIIYGDGSHASDLHYKAIDTTGGRGWIHDEYGVDSLFYMNMKHDSINNRADTFMGGFPPVVQKLYLTNTDTSSAFQRVLPVNINVPAGNKPAMSVSFKSGDPTFTFGDTVFTGNTGGLLYKYGMFRPFVTFAGTQAVPTFAVNSKDDMNEGTFRDVGYNRVPNGLYRPHWFWYNASTNGAATNQYPYFAFHITCTTCGVVGVNEAAGKIAAVKAYPNPANNVVTLSFDGSKANTGSLTLNNLVGQQVITQNINNIHEGKITLNTATLPAGIYIYTLTVDGMRSAGRIVVAH